MNKDMLYRYVELMNQYSVTNTLTPEEINFVNQVHQISQNDSNLVQLINQLKVITDPNERLNLVNNFYAPELEQQLTNEAPSFEPDINMQNQIEAPTTMSNVEVQNQFETPTLMPNEETQSQFEAPVLEPSLNIPAQENNLQDVSNMSMDQSNQQNNFNNFIDNIDSGNYEANVYDKPKQLKKAGFVNPFIFSLILGFVGGAITTTLMIILK